MPAPSPHANTVAVPVVAPATPTSASKRRGRTLRSASRQYGQQGHGLGATFAGCRLQRAAVKLDALSRTRDRLLGAASRRPRNGELERVASEADRHIDVGDVLQRGE